MTDREGADRRPVTCSPVTAVVLTYSADGTRYRLLVTHDNHGGLSVVAPDFGWTFWGADYTGGEVRLLATAGRLKPSKVDRVNLATALDAYRGRVLGGSRG